MRDTWLLGRFERNLADIKRWAIVRTTREQSVAEHSYYVALMVPRLLMEYGYNDPPLLMEAVTHALTHDMSEVMTGDIATPIKKRLPDGVFAMMEMEFGFPMGEVNPVIAAATKVIDLFEAAAFLAEEIAIGNGRVVDVQRVIKIKLSAASAKFEAMAKKDNPSLVTDKPLGDQLGDILHAIQYSKIDPLEPDMF